MGAFEGVDLAKLLDRDGEFGQKYVFGELTDEMLRRAEEIMGYRLPPSYRELLRFQNGGRLREELYEDSWLTEIFGIAADPASPFGLEEAYRTCRDCGFPEVGIPFGGTHSAFDDMYYMDFRAVEKGEPRIVRIDNADDNAVYFIAKDLPEFLRLVLDKEYIEEELLD